MKPHTQGVQATALPNPTTLDEIIFEQRNKDYGAYELRTKYSQNLNRALWIGVGCFGLMLLTNFIFARQKENSERIVSVDLTAQKIPDEPLPELEKPKEVEPPKPVEQVKTITFLVPEVVEETNNEMPPPDYDAIENSVISDKTQDGIETDEIAAAPPTEVKSVEKTIVELPEEDNTAFITVEVQPSFMGGNSEMYKFLSKNLKYPTAAQRANIQGKVFLSFIVEKDGSITDIETMKGIGFGCDEEAMRVVKLMPKWIAGKQNGRNVRVKFTIPVFFRLDD
ncbi:cell envelope biogenesis protein TonB [Emticicia aquatilis]|uniref:Cell envelope biogenesis protein TonB n=1 Tax=Emticicia aquatilis TaxID=1537369 RepID=A0A917DJV4_9BACT|nr:energy transducer TonB [Emticicia aquatilis]GGD42102.1 cell envelope biogenesis protein TonB [Emticicia aquatilis]